MRKNVEFFLKRELKSMSYWIYQGSFLGEPICPVARLHDHFCGFCDALRLASLYLMSAFIVVIFVDIQHRLSM